MRNRTIAISVFFLCLIGSIIMILIFKDDYKYKNVSYLTTSYSKESTIIVNNDSFVEYPIKCVEKVYKLSVGNILADKYGNKALLLSGEEQTAKSITLDYCNIYDIKEYNGYLFILFSYAMNKCKVVKYDLTFNKICESVDLLGVPRNIVVFNEAVFLVANDYSNAKRRVTLTKLSTKHLESELEVEVNSLVFAFYIEENKNDIVVIGNISEADFSLGIVNYDEKLLKKNEMEFQTPVQWVRKVVVQDDYQYILNDLSIVKLNSNYELVQTFNKDGFIIIDMTINENYLYILCINDNADVFIDTIELKTFSSISSQQLTIGCDNDYMVPSCILSIL